ncbi:MAG: hypothetical protein Udaeo_06940 [Candidatus Udaeobacter sp.]|nr:MAG: hypothetical protein Udaeo_06940 [Candidatus Udaeobacter sp.]
MQRFEEFRIHALAVEQRIWLSLRRKFGQARFPIVEQSLDIAFVHPKLLEPVHLFVVDECLRQEDGIETAGGSAGEDVDYETRTNLGTFAVFEQKCGVHRIAVEILSKASIEPGAGA